MEALAVLGGLMVVVILGAVLSLRAGKRPRVSVSADDPSEQQMTLDMILDESEKTNELLRQLIRAYGHEPEA